MLDFGVDPLPDGPFLRGGRQRKLHPDREGPYRKNTFMCFDSQREVVKQDHQLFETAIGGSRFE